VARAPCPALPAGAPDRVHDRRASAGLTGRPLRARGGLEMVPRSCPHGDAGESPARPRPAVQAGPSLSRREIRRHRAARSRFPSRLTLTAFALMAATWRAAGPVAAIAPRPPG